MRDRATGATETVDAHALFLMIGAQPNTDWLPATIERDPDGFIVTGPALSSDMLRAFGRQPLALETSLPRVLAAGDVRNGSVRRVASAVGEGSIAIRLIHRLFPIRSDFSSPALRYLETGLAG